MEELVRRDRTRSVASSTGAASRFLGSGTARAARRRFRCWASGVPEVGSTTTFRLARTVATCGTVPVIELGYARVSTVKHDLDRQIDALEQTGIPRDRIYVDKKSGATTDPGCETPWHTRARAT